MQHFRFRRAEVAYLDSGTGRPVIYANAAGTTLGIWDQTIAAMPEIRAIRFDLPGHGASAAWADEAYHMGHLVGLMAAQIDHLGLRDIVAIGQGMGGMMVQGLAAERPDLVRSGVLIGTAPRLGSASRWAAEISHIQALGTEGISAAMVKNWVSRGFHSAHPAPVAALRQMLAGVDTGAYAACLSAIADTDLYESSAALRQPFSVVVGRDDTLTPPDVLRDFSQMLQRSKYHLIPKAGHLVSVESPLELASIIRGHCDISD